MRTRRALSIRQPYAELIMRGIKKVEYRSRPTHIRERVYVYAGLQPGDSDAFRAMKKKPGDLLVGVLIGTVEIAECTGQPGKYRWHLAKPKRLARHIRPKRHPQPGWFRPF